jgi:uncharacterized membrane protein
MKMGELVKKVVIWRCISIFVTLVTMCIATGDIKSATGITLFLHVLLTAGHYEFEHIWEKMHESG